MGFHKGQGYVQKLALDGKFGLTVAGVEGEIPEEIKAAAYKKLAESIDTPELQRNFTLATEAA